MKNTGMLVEIHSETPGRKHLNMAVDALNGGELIVYPTDTLYGLGCDIHNKSAMEKIYRLKRMDRRKPLSFICSDFTHIAEYAKISNQAYKTMKNLLPGPYTCILPATNKVPKMLVSKQRTVGIRIPDNNFARVVVKEFGSPIITTTLETDEDMVISDPMILYENFKNKVSYVFADGVSFSDPSTVLDLTGEEALVLREGKGDISWLE